jgi:ppGpp synthetase/RelA/SpoT-type nucleotidyltranferase
MPFLLDYQRLKEHYELRAPLFKALKEEVIHEVTLSLENESLKFHSITARVKSLESITAKAEDKELTNPLEELPDIVGVRVVALFLSDVKKIAGLFEKTFDVHLVDNKIDDGDSSKFGYLSIHIHGKLKSHFSGTRYDLIKAISFEIQIRTIAMDAWASASHYLDYKSEEDIPSDLKRDFHALSGLFFVADKHFELFFQSRAKSITKVQHSLIESTNGLNQELNLDTLTAYLCSKYPDRTEVSSDSISQLVTSLRQAGYDTLEKLDSKLREKEFTFLEYERVHPPGPEPMEGDKFNIAGVVRVSLEDDLNFEPELKQHLINTTKSANRS